MSRNSLPVLTDWSLLSGDGYGLLVVQVLPEACRLDADAVAEIAPKGSGYVLITPGGRFLLSEKFDDAAYCLLLRVPDEMRAIQQVSDVLQSGDLTQGIVSKLQVRPV